MFQTEGEKVSAAVYALGKQIAHCKRRNKDYLDTGNKVIGFTKMSALQVVMMSLAETYD